MKRKDACIIAVTAIVTACMVRFCGEFAWQVIASLCAAVLMAAFDKSDAQI
jgi:hypothetical protein